MFSFYSPQALHFGRGQAAQTAALAAGFGARVLIVHGANTARAAWLIEDCHAAGLSVVRESCGAEPSLPALEAALGRIGTNQPDVVIALGGGSVIDFAKALAALIPCAGKPLDYLEGVGGGKPVETAPLPMIALPTTAGTGAEVTKNAVIAVPEHAVKVSLRDARMIPDIAIVDAALMQGAPRRVTLAAGLDAVTQVIEPYLSVKATPMTDALCQAAIPKGLAALRAIVEQDAADAWDDMAWVSTCGGLALANAGLGAVHGFAGVIGGQTGAPHGEICGALLPAVLASHVEKAKAGTQVHTRLMWVLGLIDTAFEVETGAGLSALRNWSRDMGLRDLAQMGLDPEEHAQVAKLSAGASSMKGTPFALTETELIAILRA
ncbi:iron-containing alcohol dehydrogenase [Sulfitobacter sp. BSw21498]|uniref:iron-containing alcohol dehydrogenase n=1 Tax=Sulfitobacter sp. BSw21498 TaxID=664426 RepID=UPI001110DEB2|nr:iron-containing alcohol dehydrogenase [Sulfitobacter sp. BSw21498]